MLSRLRNNRPTWDFFAGAILTGGTTTLAPAVDYGLFSLQAYKPFNLRRECVALALIVAASALYVTDWYAPVIWGIRLVLLGSLVSHVRVNRQFVAGSVFVLLVQLGFMLWQLTHGIDRAWGISPNASVVGMSGFALFGLSPIVAIFAGLTLGLSISRAYVLCLAVLLPFALWKGSGKFFVLGCLTVLVSVITTVQVGQAPRLMLASDNRNGTTVTQAMNLRNALNNPANMEPQVVTPNSGGYVDGRPAETVIANEPPIPALWRQLRTRPFGFGYRDYIHETGRPIPHNQFVLILYELGWLTVPFLVILGCMTRQGSLQWRHVLALLPALLLTAEFYGRSQGVYALFLYLISVHRFIDVWDE